MRPSYRFEDKEDGAAAPPEGDAQASHEAGAAHAETAFFPGGETVSREATTPAASSASMRSSSIPRTLRSTWRVSSPSIGGGLGICPCWAANPCAGRISEIGPSSGCSSVWMTPRSTTDGDCKASATVLTGPAGTSAARQASIQWLAGCVVMTVSYTHLLVN